MILFVIRKERRIYTKKNSLMKAQESVRELSNELIEYWITFYNKRKDNICIKMERGVYSLDQANRNYERASMIYNVFELEKKRRIKEYDKIIQSVIK
jgi:hypothetical protein